MVCGHEDDIDEDTEGDEELSERIKYKEREDLKMIYIIIMYN